MRCLFWPCDNHHVLKQIYANGFCQMIMRRYQSSSLTLHLTHAYAICYPWQKRKSNLAENNYLHFDLRQKQSLDLRGKVSNPFFFFFLWSCGNGVNEFLLRKPNCNVLLQVKCLYVAMCWFLHPPSRVRAQLRVKLRPSYKPTFGKTSCLVFNRPFKFMLAWQGAVV